MAKIEQADIGLPENKINRLIENLRPLVDLIARNGVKLQIVRKGPSESLYFDHKTGTCVINLDFLENKGFKDAYEILFGCAHETGHFIQALEDIKGYELIFKLIEEKAEEITKRVLQNPESKSKIIESVEDLPEKVKEQSEEELLNYIFRKVYHQLINVVLDINVNANIIRRIIPFQEGKERASVPKEVYRTKLFPSQKENEPPTYTSLPYYSQLSLSLLRNYMTKERTTISEPVKDAMGESFRALGEEINLEQLAEKYISAPDTKAFDLYIYLTQFILPIFDKLLWKDIEECRFKIVIAESDLHGVERVDGHGEKVIEDIKKWQEEKKESAEKKQKKFAEDQFKSAGRERGFSEKEVEELWEIEQAARKVIDILKNIWYLFLRRESIIDLQREGVFRFGISPNILAVIQQLFIQKMPPQETKVMERYVPTEKIILLPRKIKLALVLDLSDSMGDEKRRAVQKVTYSILHSLLRFSEELKLNLNLSNFPIDVEFKIIGFGSSVIELPRFQGITDEITFVNRAILDIRRIGLGGTEDDKALKIARDFFEHEDVLNIKEGKTLAIALEITDGETSTPNSSRTVVEEINDSGIFCRAIQIPGSIYSEIKKDEKELQRILVEPTDTFKEVWHDKGLQIRDLSQLPDIIIELLKTAIEVSEK